jgi:hypothetical protein
VQNVYIHWSMYVNNKLINFARDVKSRMRVTQEIYIKENKKSMRMNNKLTKCARFQDSDSY